MAEAGGERVREEEQERRRRAQGQGVLLRLVILFTALIWMRETGNDQVLIIHRVCSPVAGNLSYWRDVRASFVIPKLGQTVDANNLPQTGLDGPAHCLPRKWAHSIPMPESGCVLVATEELDGNGTFERTVILLFRLGSRDAYDGHLVSS
ncbi:hypothetical protein GUJ93_ZPchr0663g11367 [Zizania palustris]|uniref:Uncharacterized protein n=1 Tax=Zizania palustris TaxID=103762 RepID=A0A8J5UTH3_ZIZPA|nr:hypothetical protein GUJ93_ZPchr0663g11367 [Zizania palustris]